MAYSADERSIKAVRQNIYKYCFCLSLIYLLFYSCASTPDQQLRKGIYYQGRGQYDKAITEYENLLKQGIPMNYRIPNDPDNRSIGGLLAIAYVFNMDPDTATKIARNTLNKNPEDATALASLGVAQIFKRDFANAKANLQKAIAVMPGLWHAYNWIAAIYLIENDIEGAEAALEKSIDINPGNHIARNWIVIIECLKGNQQTAIKEFKRTVISMKLIDTMSTFKYDERVHLLYLSLNAILKGDLDDANLQLQKCVEEKSSGGEFLFGVTYLLKGDRLSAIKYLEKESKSKSAFCFLSKVWLAALYANEGNLDNLLKAESTMSNCFTWEAKGIRCLLSKALLISLFALSGEVDNFQRFREGIGSVPECSQYE